MLRSIASNPGLRGNLQRARSNPALRAAVASPMQAPPALPSRSLVSTVLLTRDAYDSKRVAELKGELKQRGLSTAGKRSDLIKRLVESDQNRAKVLPTTADKINLSPSKAGKSRTASTRTATSALSSSENDSQFPPATSAGVAGGEGKGATIPHPPNMEPGQVSASFIDPSRGGVVAPEKLEAQANAPGVPPEKTARAPTTFEVKIPYEPEPSEYGPEIPLMTSYFHPENSHFAGGRADEAGPIAHVPKVRTVSGEETYPGGGISHHQPVFDESHIIGETDSEHQQEQQSAFSSALSSLFSSVQKDLGISAEPSAPRQVKEVSSTAAETTRSLLRDARESFSSVSSRVGGGSSGSGSASYSTAASYTGGNARPLTDEERSGLYVLGGIVLGGFLLGGLGKQSQRKTEKVQSDIQQRVNEVRKQAKKMEDDELAALVQRAEAVLKSQ